MGLSVGSRVYGGCVSGVGYLCAVGYLDWCSDDGCVGGLFFYILDLLSQKRV